MSEITQAGGDSRRRFLQTGLMAAGAALASDWRSRRAFAAANDAVVGAGNRVKMGFIGVGNMGGAHLSYFLKQKDALNVEVVAVSDCYSVRLDKAKAKVVEAGNANVATYADYRKLLDDKNVDAVLVATPEHWHAKMLMDALDAGKDIYLEKPLCLKFEDAKKCWEFWRTKHKDRVVQLGNQNSSDPKFLRIHELLPQIGHLVWSQNSYCRNTPTGEWNSKIDDDAAGKIDWKMFTGCEFGLAPDRPFDAERFFRWRKYWDYSSGICGDLLAHRIFPYLIAIYGTGMPQLPKRVTANGGNYVHKTDREVPDTFLMTCDYPDDHTIFLAGSTENEKGVEPMIRGQKAQIEFLAEAGGKISLTPQRPFSDDLDPLSENAPDVNPQLHEPHRNNFIDCVRSRKQTNCHMDLAYAGMVALALADLSYRHSMTCNFDPVKGELLNPPKAE
jgi:predicted dehydrogenase